jgi:HAE1 family hydrophobic/amphiphilic exporter-1
MNAKGGHHPAMKEVTAPVIATTLVLVAVFIPVAVMGGITGRLYQQFAITVAVSVVFSSINALTLSPALCGMLLRKQKPMRGPLGPFSRLQQGCSTSPPTPTPALPTSSPAESPSAWSLSLS